ncbi:MAG: hypothetical protein QOE64_1735 [Frankiales bacterium]|nr:hypothetical protein [Frankiales bacterium]
MRARPARALTLALGIAVVAGAVTAASSSNASPGAATRSLADALGSDAALGPVHDTWPRAAVPTDRYELAGGCYAMRSDATGRYVARTASGFAGTAAALSAAEPFHLQAYDLGKYLLYGTKGDFLSGPTDPAANADATATQTARGYVAGTTDEQTAAVRQPALDAIDAAAAQEREAAAPARSAAAGNAVIAATQPSAAAEWYVEHPAGGGFILANPVDDGDPADPGPLNPPIAGLLTNDAGALSITPGQRIQPSTRFSFVLTTGCTSYPEIGAQVDGPPYTAPSEVAEAKGYIDAHLHGMAFEFLGGKARCGRPWHPYGPAYALVDCPDHAAGGRGAILEDVVSGHTPGQGHDNVGWPTFGYWPNYDSLTHEQTYYAWLERAWRGGLRMYTNLLVENNVLCQIYPYKQHSCNEMDSVRLQAATIRQMIRYIDAQYGGPGKGWLQIVTDPFQARRVINAGRLAVVLGIEVSVPFDCRDNNGTPGCTAAQLDQRLDEVYKLGVRQMELTNKFDNALTGVTGDGGTTGVLVNAANRYNTGHFWKYDTCPKGGDPARTDNRQYNFDDDVAQGDSHADRDSIFGGVLSVFGGMGIAPTYNNGPQCNAMGLSELGKHAIVGLMKHGMIFDPDHMSALAREQAMNYVLSTGYSGVVSSHSWSDTPTYHAVLKAGGVVTPHASGDVLGEWRDEKAHADPRFYYGVGYGSDVNGFSHQPGPIAGVTVTYPITGLGGVQINKQVSGVRTYDVNRDGVDHYGLYADWIQALVQKAGAEGPALRTDFERGAEAFLQMWERAIGVPGDACRADVPDLSRDVVKQVKHGMSWEEVVTLLGQPSSRGASDYTFCSEQGAVTVSFDASGQVKHIAT